MGNGKEARMETETSLGGADNVNYQRYDGVAYFDKPDHLLRSVSHQPNHAVFINKLPRNNGLDRFQGTISEIDVHPQDQIIGVPSDQYRWNKRKMKRIRWY